MNGGYSGTAIINKPGRVILIVGIDDIDQMMRCHLPLSDSGLGGANVHIAVDLHGINTDNLAIELIGQPKGKLGLADGRGADQDQDRFVYGQNREISQNAGSFGIVLPAWSLSRAP